MEDLKQFKCKTCGEVLDVTKAHDGVLTCEICGGTYVLPKEDSTTEVRMLLIEGEHDLDTGKFDDAKSAYSKVIEKDPDEPEAYWGMALANNGIQYLLDEKVENIFGGNSKRLQPICHRIDDEKFTDDPYYNRALDCATPDQRTEYEKRAAEIDHIKREFYRLKQTGLDYDCFICVKVSKNTVADPSAKTAEDEKTEDSEFAHKIFRMLKDNSYVPFYSEAVLKDETGADYEAHILYALATSETMLVICFDETYLDTKWVKNEYTRFLKLVNDEEKESDSIAIVYKGNTIERLPGKNGKIQGIDAGKIDYSHRILKFVDSHTPETQRKRAEAKQRAEEEAKRRAEEERQRAEEFNRIQENARKRDEDARKRDEEINRKLEEFKKLSQSQAVGRATVNSLLELAQINIEAEKFADAKANYDEILKSQPKNAQAWFGKMLLEFNCGNDEELAQRLTDNNFYEKFKANATVRTFLRHTDGTTLERYKNLFAKRKESLQEEIDASLPIIDSFKARISRTETEIGQINEEINGIRSEIDNRNEELSNKQTELDGLNAILAEKEKEASPHQEKADAARAKKNKIKKLDHFLVGSEFLSDFWLDEGSSFTLPNAWDTIFDTAGDIQEWCADTARWHLFFKVIIFPLWIFFQLMRLLVFPLAFIVAFLPFFLVMCVASVLILVSTIPVNLFILIYNLINMLRRRSLHNLATLEQNIVTGIVKEPKENAYTCTLEKHKINEAIKKLQQQIDMKELQIGLLNKEIGDFKLNIDTKYEYIETCKNMIAAC